MYSRIDVTKKFKMKLIYHIRPDRTNVPASNQPTAHLNPPLPVLILSTAQSQILQRSCRSLCSAAARRARWETPHTTQSRSPASTPSLLLCMLHGPPSPSTSTMELRASTTTSTLVPSHWRGRATMASFSEDLSLDLSFPPLPPSLPHLSYPHAFPFFSSRSKLFLWFSFSSRSERNSG